MVGQRLGGRYQLEERIGGGGMAIVYKAKDLLLHRTVAVKVLRPQFGIDEDFINRFRREAQAVASLSHPNVVSVYDVGQDDDTHYIVMEYIEGQTLKDLINQHGALPIEEAIRIAVQVCDALEHAHQNKIIHRDIKPHNILIGNNGRVKVTDFGIARAATSATITHTNSVLGSVHYFSPEQARGGFTAEKSDIYSLGIVLYEMVTGQLPFSGDSPITVALKHLQDPLTDPREINPRIPQSVENVILKALVKDPFLRYGSAMEMLTDLETCLSPERQNEPKIEFPVDEEQTRVYPRITEDMLGQAQAEREHYRKGTQAEEEGKGNKRWWVRAIGWTAALGLFVILALFGFNLVQKLFEVPEIDVPHVVGTPYAIAEAKIREAHLEPVKQEQHSNSIEAGSVISQDPAPPMRLKENAKVLLVVSLGKKLEEMPNLMSQSRSLAEQQLKVKGFAVTEDTFVEKEDETAPPGVVIDQFPAAGEKIVPGETAVKLTISKGKKFVELPDLQGLTEEEAKVRLFQLGLKVGEITHIPTYLTEESGIVISTIPFEPNMRVEAGRDVPLQVSNGSYPNDAKIGTEPILVEYTGDVEGKVRILVTDARGERQQVVNASITTSMQYDVPFVLSPQKRNATIEVYMGDEKVPVQTRTISYDDIP